MRCSSWVRTLEAAYRTGDITESQGEDAMLLPFIVKHTNELYDSINLIGQKPERKLALSTKNDIGTARVLA